MDSITRRLARIWKTSTSLALAILSAFILATAHFTNVSLAGIATFGLLLVALQALSFTREQSNEWRRKAIHEMAQNTEHQYTKIASKVFSMLYWAKLFRSGTHKFHDITPLDEDEIKEAYKLAENLEIINSHLKSINIKDIDYTINIFHHAISLSMIRNALDRNGSYKEEIITQASEDFIAAFDTFNNSVLNRHGKGLPGQPTEMRFISYIRDINQIGITHAD
ncbi:hypothetical protein [Halomonas icarae]|uniref:DUF4760 domain-containing protein n=1 Tax=Halomonas icarae TaxID=2691040 RepID=A0A7X4W1T1_9GAMM|nr:hypothetical protein [Halomonas icarae]MDR5903636.1 hypothetical protein [Halomonas icarae]NAW14336.1 hypothetical protein [Halomonas icarae]